MIPEHADVTPAGPAAVPPTLTPSRSPHAGTEWTTEVPVLLGWYWLRQAVFHTGAWQAARASCRRRVVPATTGQLVVYVTGSTWTRSVADLIVGEWNGPVALPD